LMAAIVEKKRCKTHTIKHKRKNSHYKRTAHVSS